MFSYRNSIFEIDQYYLGIKPIKVIWDRDTSPGHKVAKEQLMWLYYFYSYRSPYKTYRDDKKHAAILKDVFDDGLNTTWDPFKDDEFQVAVTWYKEHIRNNPYWDSYKAMKTAMERLQNILLDEKSTVYDLAKARTELESWPKSLKKMEEEAIKEDMVLDSKIKGNKLLKPGEVLPPDAMKREIQD